MKAALVWIKNNPIAVVAAFLGIAALVTILFVQIQAAAFTAELEKRNGEIQRITNLTRTNVEVPAQDLDQGRQNISITVNQQTILDLKEVYGRMSEEYENIFSLAVDFNEGDHQEMLEGLLPDPRGDEFKLFDARGKYRQAFSEMFYPHSPSALYPRLDAGPPVPLDEVSAELARVEQEFLQSLFPRRSSLDELREEELKTLEQRKRDALVSALTNHASKFHIYAISEPSSAEFPLEIDKWSEPGTGAKPTLPQIWEGQLGLWIQQDIVQAIGQVNQVWDPKVSVLTAPVKRLLDVELVKGYVGISSSGGMRGAGTTSAAPEAALSAEKRIPDDFSKAPTGRRSNSIYDVKHVWVTVHVDYQRLPQLFEALAATNFMSVLKIELTDVDEYAVLEKGYVYGWNDVVEARILIESLWLREWTSELMPRNIRRFLGIKDEPAPGGAAIPAGVGIRN